MVLLEIGEKDAQQRLDKYLKRLLKYAPDSLIYKQLRKKNIVLNGKKADGGEKLEKGDTVKIFFADETYQKLTGAAHTRSDDDIKQYTDAYDRLKDDISVVYENEHILVADKQVGVLSQKAVKDDVSVNEWLIGHLLNNKSIDRDFSDMFRPSVCNRLDRNTSGMIICGKTLAGSRYMSEIIRDRTLEKYYYCIINGSVDIDRRVTGYHYKDRDANKVAIYTDADEIPYDRKDDADFIDTYFKTVRINSGVTLIEAKIYTGRAHQIRAHLASLRHPIIGDAKYGDADINKAYKKIGVHSQLLHSHKLVFPDTTDERFADISGLVLETGIPPLFRKVMGDE